MPLDDAIIHMKNRIHNRKLEADPRGKNKLWLGKVFSGAKAQKIRNEKKQRIAIIKDPPYI